MLSSTYQHASFTLSTRVSFSYDRVRRVLEVLRGGGARVGGTAGRPSARRSFWLGPPVGEQPGFGMKPGPFGDALQPDGSENEPPT